jgi:hypothetical protein
MLEFFHERLFVRIADFVDDVVYNGIDLDQLIGVDVVDIIEFACLEFFDEGSGIRCGLHCLPGIEAHFVLENFHSSYCIDNEQRFLVNIQFIAKNG